MTNYDRLKALQARLDTLSPASSSEEFNLLGDFFSEDCTTFVCSMREYDEPSIGRQATVETYKEILKIYHIHKRRVLSHSISTDGRTVFSEMKHSVHIFDQILNPFYETVVAVFNEKGLIKELRQYSCRSHIVGVIQAKTGEGTYAEVPETRGRKTNDAL